MPARPIPSLDSQVCIRPMRAADADTIAAVHVESWRSAYRGLYADAYLDGSAAADRQALWRRRLMSMGEHAAGLVAEHDGHVIGFAYLDRDADPARGTLLDNLHVRPGLRGQGLGRRLLAAAAREIVARGWPPGLHLWVFESNAGARRFYERHGAHPTERAMLNAADGGAYPAWCYAWDDVTTLVRLDVAS